MTLLALIAVSIAPATLPLPATAAAPAAYGCVAAGEATLSCGASATRVAGGKGTVPAVGTRSRTAAAEGVCHSDPSKGRACRHHKAQAENDRASQVRVARDDER